MPIVAWLGIATGLVLIGLILYWLFIITEGTYLGQPIVTWMYDLVSKRYDNIKGFDADIESAYLGRPLVAELAKVRARLILDIGTGTGRLPLTLLDQARFQGRVIGVDASLPMLNTAAEKLAGYQDRCRLIHQSAMRLPFVDGAFDAVTMLEMLEFTPNPVEALREAVRVLKPGGLLLTTRRTGFDARLIPGKTYSESVFCDLLTRLGLAEVRVQRWQVDYDLVWARRTGTSAGSYSQPIETLICLKCHNGSIVEEQHHLICSSCRQKFFLANGIIKMNL